MYWVSRKPSSVYVIIYLDLRLLAGSSDYGERDGQPLKAPISILLRVGFTWHTALPRYRWALTPPFHPYRITVRQYGGLFLLHFPWSRLHRMLSGTLSYGARTFLTNYYMVRSLVLLNNSIIMQTQCCVKNKMSFILRKHSCGISIYNTKAYMVRIRPQFSHSTMLVFPATLLTTADGSII